MTEHTPTPWRLKTSGNIGNAIEADSGKRSDLYPDDGYRVVATYQECGATDSYIKSRGNAAANGAFIVKAVNNHDALVKALQLQEQAEHAHVNCDECEGEDVPELCPKCFPLYDAARLARWHALDAVSTPSKGE